MNNNNNTDLYSLLQLTRYNIDYTNHLDNLLVNKITLYSNLQIIF